MCLYLFWNYREAKKQFLTISWRTGRNCVCKMKCLQYRITKLMMAISNSAAIHNSLPLPLLKTLLPIIGAYHYRNRKHDYKPPIHLHISL